MAPPRYSLSQLFDHFPDAVLFFRTDQQEMTPAYTNPKAAPLLQDEEFLDILPQLLEQDTAAMCLPLAWGEVLLTISPLPTGRLLIVRTLSPFPEFPGLGTANSRLREHLSHLFFAWERLSLRLRQAKTLSAYEDLLSLCSKTLYQILRLVQQLELLPQDALTDFPSESLDFSTLCRELSQDLTGRIDNLPLTFTWDVEPGLFLNGRRALLEQLVLSLLSNGIKAAGPNGQVSLTLRKSGLYSDGRAELTVRDNGPGIPQDRLSRLFSPQSHDTLPRPEDGSGLDLYLAHRIASAHKGVLMAGSSPGGGAQFTLSLPLEPPKNLTLRSPDGTSSQESLSHLLTGLSDVLPAAIFFPLAEE